MKYNINDTVIVICGNENKIISDCEVVLGTEIYYMTDKTSYCVSQLKDYYDFNNNEELVNEIVNSPGLKEITDTKLNDFTKNVIKWYYSNPPTPIKHKVKPKKWFNLF